MRIRSLYTKFFLFFIGGTVVSMLLVFRLSHTLFLEHAKKKTEGFSRAVVRGIARLFESRVKEVPPGKLPAELSLICSELATPFGGRMWVTDRLGRSVAKSFPGRAPVIRTKPMAALSPFHVHKAYRDNRPAYFRTRFRGADGTGWQLHIIIDTSFFKGMSILLALGLAVIALVEGLLLFPMYRHTAKPLRVLRDTAHRLSSGELSARTALRGRDEIRELGDVFDGMAENLERFVRGTKELAANISHELRTPLARIRLASELLEGGGRHRETIHREIEKMDSMIGRILDLSRMELQANPADFRDFRLDELLQGEVELFRPLAAQQEMQIAVDVSGSVRFYHGDADAVRCGISALLENCIAHGSAGGRISVVLDAAEESGILISVVNSYDGDLPEAPEKLAAPFIKGAGSGGSGLGLVIAQRAAERHKGHLRLSSEKNIFRVEMQLPAQSR